MNEKNKNLLLRFASAAVLLPIVLLLLERGGYFSAGLMGWGAAVCAAECYLIFQRRLSPPAVAGIALAAAMPFLPVWRPEEAFAIAYWALAAFFFAAFVYHLWAGPLPEAPQRVAGLLFGLLYAGAGMTALSVLRGLPNGLEWVVSALAITWVNDTGAYFSGRFLGKHKLYPTVSPNKTWEGFFGGMLGSTAGMFAVKAVFFGELSVADCLILGVAGGVVGPLGDLCESVLKRAFGVKDSGKIIPGHGGLLDRIDALLFNGPMVLLYVALIR
ncbi:MAG: phosphatidate cytidylyltransferase [Myxococcales bacterium]|nr:phosphatidate cytidylyltransferase [Myxococcales bacterium]